jgi:hypothetical protein
VSTLACRTPHRRPQRGLQIANPMVAIVGTILKTPERLALALACVAVLLNVVRTRSHVRIAAVESPETVISSEGAPKAALA